MIPRPSWFDPAIAIGVALLMAWVACDMYSTEGVIPGLMYPAFFGVVPLLFVFCLRLPLEAFILFLIWLVAAAGLGSGLLDGVTFFPSKNLSNDVSFADSPVAFSIAMAINASLVGTGCYFALKWWRGRQVG
jgi:hypothetical protein